MSLSEKALSAENTRFYAIRACIVITAAACVWICARMCMTASGPILLSTRIPVEGQNVSTIPDLSPVEPVAEILPVLSADLIQDQTQTTDQQLIALLQSCPASQTVRPEWKIVRMRVTGYCACPICCGKFSDGRTADLHKIRKGDVFVAADKRIPFGTQMIIPGYNHDRPVEVKDRGRLIKGNRLDVFFNDHKVAKKWGTRYLDVLVKVEK
ncbi:MAG: 3D domain-containing protein [Sedimentisphaerales bacterium]|nr:3D domain-containing protein [Sedimentisphaerales bacterium]